MLPISDDPLISFQEIAKICSEKSGFSDIGILIDGEYLKRIVLPKRTSRETGIDKEQAKKQKLAG